MPIPEYTNRVIADTVKSRGVSIQEPDAFANIAANTAQQGRQLIRGVGELAGAYIEMKQERDNGIVDQFLNEFTMAKALKVEELKQQYNGGNAEGIIAAYNDWQREYLNSRKGKPSDKNDNTLYLENDEQIAAVDKAFSQDLAKSVNTMSAYVASQLNDYKDKQFAVRDEMLMDELSGEVDLNNIAITEDMLRDNLKRRYPNQSQEFYDSQMKKKMRAAMSANIKNDMIMQPEYALEKLNNPYIQEKLGEEETDNLTLEAGKNYVDREVDRISSEKAVGNDVPDEFDNWESGGFVRYRNAVGDKNIKEYAKKKIKEQTNIKKNNIEEKLAKERHRSLVKMLQEMDKTELADKKRKEKLQKKFNDVMDYIDRGADRQQAKEQKQMEAEARALQRAFDKSEENAFKQAMIVRNEFIESQDREGDSNFQSVLKDAHDLAPDETQFIIDTYTKAKDMDVRGDKVKLYTLAEQRELEPLPDSDARKQEYLEEINSPDYGYFAKEQSEGESVAKVLQKLSDDKYTDFSSLMSDIKDMSPRDARNILDSWKTDEGWKQFTQYALADRRVPNNLDRLMTRALNTGQKKQLSRNKFIRNAMQEQAQYDILKYLQGHPEEVMTSQVLSQILASSKETVLNENKEIIELDSMLKDIRSSIYKSRGGKETFDTSLIASEMLKRLEGNESFAELDERELAQIAKYLINNEAIMAQYVWENRR